MELFYVQLYERAETVGQMECGYIFPGALESVQLMLVSFNVSTRFELLALEQASSRYSVCRMDNEHDLPPLHSHTLAPSIPASAGLT